MHHLWGRLYDAHAAVYGPEGTRLTLAPPAKARGNPDAVAAQGSRQGYRTACGL